MEERRGESSDMWTEKAGTALKEYVSAVKECDAMGIDPTWDLPARVARLQDIHQGSPLMAEERKRKLENNPEQKINTFADIYGNVLDALSKQG